MELLCCDIGCSAESLLLGSLLWFLGIMCVSTLPVNPLLLLDLEEEGKMAPEREAGSKNFEYVMGVKREAQSFVKSRRCKASWTKMKPFPASSTTFLIS